MSEPSAVLWMIVPEPKPILFSLRTLTRTTVSQGVAEASLVVERGGRGAGERRGAGVVSSARRDSPWAGLRRPAIGPASGIAIRRGHRDE